MVYDPEIILALIGMLQKLSTSRADTKAPEVFIAFTIRNPATYQLFQAELGGCLFHPVFNSFAFLPLCPLFVLCPCGQHFGVAESEASCDIPR